MSPFLAACGSTATARAARCLNRALCPSGAAALANQELSAHSSSCQSAWTRRIARAEPLVGWKVRPGAQLSKRPLICHGCPRTLPGTSYPRRRCTSPSCLDRLRKALSRFQLRLFDHLLGPHQQCRGHRNAHRISGLEVEHQFEFGWPFDRSVRHSCSTHQHNQLASLNVR
jgi:hypothetical protein